MLGTLDVLTTYNSDMHGNRAKSLTIHEILSREFVIGIYRRAYVTNWIFHS